MSLPTGPKDQAVYHTILGEMHRLQGILISMRTIDAPETEQSLREHFAREQRIVLGKLTEWRNHRPEIYRTAEDDFRKSLEL